MHSYGPGERGPAIVEIRAILAHLGLLDAGLSGSSSGSGNRGDAGRPSTPGDCEFDHATEVAVRTFQQSRGLNVDGRVGDETWRALDAARWTLGDRMLYHAMPDPMIGDDVRQLQERLLEMGFDVGRSDGVFGQRTAKAVARFQREVGIAPDGAYGPHTMAALRRLGRKVVGGHAQAFRESERFRHAGPTLVGKTIVIDPGHGGTDPGVVVADGLLRWTEADLTFDIATRLEGRLGAAGMRVFLTRGPRPAVAIDDRTRAKLANDLGADLLLSIHLDGNGSEAANGVATYHYGTSDGVVSTVGERLAGLVQREILARTGLRDCRTHPKSWDLLRLTRMPAVRVDLAYLTSASDRALVVQAAFRNRIVEAMIAAVQRMYFPVEQDVKTGSIDVSTLRAALPTAVA